MGFLVDMACVNKLRLQLLESNHWIWVLAAKNPKLSQEVVHAIGLTQERFFSQLKQFAQQHLMEFYKIMFST